MNASTIGVTRSKGWLRVAWFVALLTAITLTLAAMERTTPGRSAAGAPAVVDLPLALASHGVASNTSSASNVSNGTAIIGTGDATATGVVSSTNIVQRADVRGGGISIINQNVNVSISGTATANTGGNTAVGNASTNTAISSSSSG